MLTNVNNKNQPNAAVNSAMTVVINASQSHTHIILVAGATSYDYEQTACQSLPLKLRHLVQYGGLVYQHSGCKTAVASNQ